MEYRRRKFPLGHRARAKFFGIAVALFGLVAVVLLPAAHAMIGCDDDDDAPVASATLPTTSIASNEGHPAPSAAELLNHAPTPAHPYHDESNCPICRLILACQHSVPPMPAIAPAPFALVTLIERLPEPARFVPRETVAPRSSRGPPMRA